MLTTLVVIGDLLLLLVKVITTIPFEAYIALL